MNWDIFEGNWKQVKGLGKVQGNEVAHEHRDVIAGKRDELAGKILKASPQRKAR